MASWASKAFPESMPLFLLRDGSYRRFSVVPEGLLTSTHRDRHQRRIHVLLDAESERTLLLAQPRFPVRGRRRGSHADPRQDQKAA
jgi:hypothetical protein